MSVTHWNARSLHTRGTLSADHFIGGPDTTKGVPTNGLRGYGQKDGVIEIEGTIVEALPNAMFRVELTNGTRCSPTSPGKMRQHYIRILPEDRVVVEHAPTTSPAAASSSVTAEQDPVRQPASGRSRKRQQRQ